MSKVTIVLTDTPTGGIAVHHDFTPAVGAPCTQAQAAALDIINRTQREWGAKEISPKAQPQPKTE